MPTKEPIWISMLQVDKVPESLRGQQQTGDRIIWKLESGAGRTFGRPGRALLLLLLEISVLLQDQRREISQPVLVSLVPPADTTIICSGVCEVMTCQCCITYIVTVSQAFFFDWRCQRSWSFFFFLLFVVYRRRLKKLMPKLGSARDGGRKGSMYLVAGCRASYLTQQALELKALSDHNTSRSCAST